MYHCSWPKVAWLPDVTWPKVTSQEVTSQYRKWMIPLGCDLNCSRCCIVRQGCFLSRRFLTVVFLLHNRRVKWMKWYIWSPKSPIRRSLCIYPGLWLALYRGCINLFFLFSLFTFFFHTTCLTSNNTNFCTMSVASTGFSKSLVMSVMLCPAHRWMR
jgi:hypothetical protein